jgi:hypothetical protein
MSEKFGEHFTDHRAPPMDVRWLISVTGFVFLVRPKGYEIPEQCLSMLCENALGMELHSVDRIFIVP